MQYESHISRRQNHYKFQLKNSKIRSKIDTPSKCIHDRPFSWPGTDTSTKCSGVEQVLCVQISLLNDMVRSCKYVPLTVITFGLEM